MADFDLSSISFDASNLTANSGLIASLLYYAFFAAGSFTAGYVFLRLLQPQIREDTKAKKLSKAILAGIIFFALASAVDYFASGQEKFLQASGWLPSFAAVLLAFAIAVHKAIELMHHKPSAVIAAAPVQVPEQNNFENTVVKNVPEKHGFMQTVFEQKKPLETQLEIPRITVLKPTTGKTVKPNATVTPTTTTATKAIPAAPGIILPPKPAPAQMQQQQMQLQQTQRQQEVQEMMQETQPPALEATPTANAPVAELPPKKQGFLDKIFGVFKKKPAAAPTVVKKPYEETDAILTELNVVTPLPQQPKTSAKTPAAGTQASTANAPSQSQHRMYLQKQPTIQQTTQQAPSVSPQRQAMQNKAMQERMEKQELSELMKDLNPVAKPTQPALKQATQPAKPVAKSNTAAAGKQEEKPLSMNDLFGESAAPSQPTAQQTQAAAASASSSLFAQLEAPAAQAKQMPSAAVATASVVKPLSPTTCPNCRAKTNKIIYCPYCGSALCANCTPALKPTPDAFIYTCPKCREEITVKKQAPI